MNKDKLVLPISILLGCIVLGGFYYASQLSKQESIEKQQQISLQARTTVDQVKANQDKTKQRLKQAELQAKLEQEKKNTLQKEKRIATKFMKKNKKNITM